MRRDIIRLYKQGKKEQWPDDKEVDYKHYLAGWTTCQFKYVKELYKLISL